MVCSIELQEDPKVKVNLSETFIRRPIATSLLMLAIAMFSVIAYGGLSVSDLPG
jgi:HAE1 family hydrophobic/amphiphilic exporter-1